MKQNPITLTRAVLLWIMLGVVCGLLGATYWIILSHIMAGFEQFNGLSLLIVMPLAGFLIGLVIHYLGNPGEIGLIIDNIHLNGGRLPMRENPSMILSSLISIASGGSAGPEAPMVQITGSMGTWLADRFRLHGEALRTISIAGMASGFTVLFGAPLGGTFFALEILHHQYVVQYYEAILPAIVASCAGYTIFVAITKLGISPIWHFPLYNVEGIYDFAEAIACGIIGAIAGWLFIAMFRGCSRLFESLPQPIYVKTTLAGLGLGILAFLFPLTRFFGEHQLETIIEGNFSLVFLLGLALAKMLAISVTVNGGWRGGIIIPLFFIGACLGKAIWLIYPEFKVSLAMICVMAALNSSVTKTPISTTLLLAKLAGFTTFTPILFASTVGFFLSPRLPFIHSQHQK
ncbi:Cl- channel voltage-gated family protein [Stanieria cyanosphaera PCC 7437]|uniref:Cl-channel voltage-gated family protein n=1 Tax=Stanieria cyanosphaera (strain ATCC 29371 / PCC 7437) TaxID=111780 RepID=K9XQ67_STAC7|nr:chloride channel protein [Stanieria cyanosphaera]AFZ34765.1 Cl- channel voltage-gated family protein [Stanieria cyanosphaera PCC 7437]